MKKTIAAIIVSVCVGAVGGFVCGYDYSESLQQTKIASLNHEISQLENAISLKDSEYNEVYAEKQKYWKEKDNLVVYGIKLCKSMKDERSCLMELAIKGNLQVDFKD
ncbi:Uncharacterised protein [Escherichia coli]|uniref:hypothetical protein n=1 Tax=Escherichia coli TaxID=562 RepID=UPI00191A4CA4|nr:hypothetical protein [Escherichia coli]UMT09731.1 hypothetical protein AOY62_14940 [Escherichia coli]CAD5752452.1 Uncharacterised protein [Escherichia coli]CAD6112864.1 Uncharacterised protein [Escherichia coli]CAD6530626.1 Uncharacterised protein [Escherichia coli]